MLYAPDIADRVQCLAEHLRSGLRLPERLRALAILVTATRHCAEDAQHFVGLHALRSSGLAADKQATLAAGDHPANLIADEELVYCFASELAATGRIGEATFTASADIFGRDVVIELVALCGYVAMLTVMLNITQTRFADA